MLRTMSGHAANKLLFADKTNEIGGNKVILETSIKKTGIRFFITGSKLASAKLR